MAGVPTAAVVSVALPRPTPPSPLPEERQRQPNPLTPFPRKEGGTEPNAADTTQPEVVLSPSPLRGGVGEGLQLQPPPLAPCKGSPPPPPSQGARGAGGVGSADSPFSERGVGLAEQLYLGLRDVADAFGVAIVGGDTNTWTDKLVISVTALGEATARGPVRRSGAKPGDWLFVTGPLGGSISGHHLDFTPRVREALLLHEAVELRAMLDISDGLAADLNHICEESACGAVLWAEAIPISDAARELSRTSGKTPLQHALGDGEDFELVFAVSPADGAKLLHQPPVPGLAKIGECIEAGLWIEEGAARKPLAPTGWVHAL
ncbi:thiamine-monophosphate kinase [Gemmata sp. G18]|uniref:Thiamine-monophosphate kinase n=2 Tax=Gemmata palustris TaxID=2822762 RepID=A0ABS5BJV6_9BACT|nr:thiamine-monophosphate kinase [Gemmata palustris]